jgi:hypothetical protein
MLASFAGTLPAFAASPSVAELDAAARASGNRPDIATQIGDRVFSSTLPAQVSQISANEFGGHLVLGIRMWGVKFHKPITQREFVGQVAWLVRTAFAIAPSAQEVDVWTSVPIDVTRDIVVSGDLARPTSRVVFTLSVPHTASDAATITRLAAGGAAFWDREWARTAFVKATS